MQRTTDPRLRRKTSDSQLKLKVIPSYPFVETEETMGDILSKEENVKKSIEDVKECFEDVKECIEDLDDCDELLALATDGKLFVVSPFDS
jgi:hypothetical protein